MRGCEMDYCIYNRELKCLLKDIKIDSAGMCSEVIQVSLKPEFLEAEKERQFEEIENRYRYHE